MHVFAHSDCIIMKCVYGDLEQKSPGLDFHTAQVNTSPQGSVSMSPCSPPCTQVENIIHGSHKDVPK